jgi:hypothetical protein
VDLVDEFANTEHDDRRRARRAQRQALMDGIEALPADPLPNSIVEGEAHDDEPDEQVDDGE